MDTDRQDNVYRIGAVANITGLSTHTIRAWERRYGMVLSHRSEGGTRLYSSEALELLILIRKLLDKGESISVLCKLSKSELEERLSRFPGHSTSVRLHRNQSSVHTGSAKIVVLGNSPFTQDHYHPTPSSSIDVEFRTENQADLFSFLNENNGSIDIGIVFYDLLPGGDESGILELQDRFPQILWVAIYNLGSRRELHTLLEKGIKGLKGPIPEMVLIDLLSSLRLPGARKVESPAEDSVFTPIFTSEQLAKLANLPTSIQCECPSHVSSIIHSLNAFEKYCKSCENATVEDAHLHAELGQETARARSIMEKMLVKVCAHDNIRIN